MNIMPLLPQIQTLLHHEQWDSLQQVLQPQHAIVVADIMEKLTFAQQMQLLARLQNASQVFEHLAPAVQVQLAQHMPIKDLANIMAGMHSDERTDLYLLFTPSIQQKILQQLQPQQQQQLKTLAAYPIHSAGAIMTADFVTLAPEMSIAQVLMELRQVAVHQEALYLTYVVDAQQTLLGVLSLRQIIQAQPEQQVSAVMHTHLVYADVYEDQEQVAKILSHYEFLALPIVDAKKRLVGIVTYDDAMDVVYAEANEDLLKASAVTTDAPLSLKSTPIFSLYRKRVLWLVVLVFGSLLSGMGITRFEEVIATHIVLVFFLPLLVGSGGNAGSQSATLMVRALATGDVLLKDWFSLLGRECLVALCLGLTMATAVAILGYIRGDIMVALVLALSMLGIVLLGCMIGMSLPFILNQLKLDPASASAPLVTSICDATGVVVYLFIASHLL